MLSHPGPATRNVHYGRFEVRGWLLRLIGARTPAGDGSAAPATRSTVSRERFAVNARPPRAADRDRRNRPDWPVVTATRSSNRAGAARLRTWLDARGVAR